MNLRRSLTYVAAGAALVMGLAACGGGGGSSPLGSGGASQAPAATDTIRIGSADFTESQLLAQIYGQALQAKGVKVDITAPIGSREVYFPALTDGSIDLIPDYTGTLLQYIKKDATQTAADDVYTALKAAVPAPLTVLDKAAAEDKDAVVVTSDFATKNNLKSIADLAPIANTMVFGGPSEFQTRPDGIPGIQKTYGVTFKSYSALDTGGPVTVKGLKDNTVQAADLFTTDPSIEDNKFVVLADPKNNFAAQNVVPLINAKKATDQVKQILNAVQAKLTTEGLVTLNRTANAPDKPNLDTVAKNWLSQNGLA
ncbi:ABC transporter substrate-binding protein [Pseudonocardia ailaonensis]|uniref:ABC transporter substrate-binding protein n=1 Tax=Pseudonocardia ailaonensis TaxID=367279 RepID=A0ABN2NMX2_9PSEU